MNPILYWFFLLGFPRAWLGVTSGSFNGLSGNNRQEILDQNNKHSLQSAKPKKEEIYAYTCIYSRQTYNSRIVSQTMVVARGAENILPTAWRRRRQPQRRSERHDRRLASQISYDRCSITIATAAFVPWKKNQSTHPFSLPVCRFASQTCYYIHTIVPPVIQ